VSVHLPPAPEHWQQAFPGLAFRIVYPLPEGGDFAQLPAQPQDTVTVEVPKILYVPILAYPVVPGSRLELLPAGGLYPLDCDPAGTSMILSWEQGAVAEILHRLRVQGMDCSAFNVPRLRREIADRDQGDPWTLDLTRICARLADHTFRLTDIRPASHRDLILEPGPGRWFLESPFRKPVRASSDGTVLLQAVPLGMHYLFETDTASCLLLCVEPDAVLLSFRERSVPAAPEPSGASPAIPPSPGHRSCVCAGDCHDR
jgi:hypothetical protein